MQLRMFQSSESQRSRRLCLCCAPTRDNLVVDCIQIVLYYMSLLSQIVLHYCYKMICNQCEGDIVSGEETVQCKMCKKPAHIACVRAATSTLLTRSTKKPDKFICKVCAIKNTETSSQGSVNSDVNEDDTKQHLLKMIKINNDVMEKLKGLDEIKKSCEFLNSKYDEFILTQEKQQKTINEMNKNIGKIISDSRDKDVVIAKLSERVSELEQLRLDNIIEISGIPVRDGENLENVIQKIADECDLSADGITDVSRIPKRRKDRVPSIEVKFATSSVRDKWLKRKKGRQLTVDDVYENGSDSKVYINEKLTSENKRLFYLAREKGKEKNYKYVWVKNGKIFVRKFEDVGITRIKNEYDIQYKIV
jgi:hypothetical protein